MLISKAYAQTVELSGDIPADMPEAPSAGEAFMWEYGAGRRIGADVLCVC